jgi:hypothetical protein
MVRPQMMGNKGDPSLEALQECARAASGWYYRLVFVVGSAGRRKSELLKALAGGRSANYINVSLSFAETLLPLPRTDRVGEVGRQLETLVAAGESGLVVLDHIEVLFLPDLRIDVVSRLRQLARNQTLIVAWPGRWSAGTLKYAVPEHPEHFEDRTIEPVSVFSL